MIGEPGRPARPVAVPIQRAPGAPSLARSPAVAARAAAILLAFLGGIASTAWPSRRRGSPGFSPGTPRHRARSRA